MAFGSPFKRSTPQSETPEQPAEEVVIDAEATLVQQTPGTAPVPRGAAVPEAAVPTALERRADLDVAVRNVAVATAGGLVAGAATIAVAVAAKSVAKYATAPTPGLSRRRKKDIVSSQSFLIDVHTLKGR
jgi:hypothetical protein